MPPARVVCSLLLLLVPHASAAAPLFTYYNESKYGFLFLDERPGGIITGYTDHSREGRAELLSPAAGVFDIVGGLLEVTSGPFISQTETPSGINDVFAQGGTVNATWVIELPDGSTRDIDFSADLGAWNPIEYGPAVGDGGGALVPFVHGMFDADDAAFLGVPSRWLKGTWSVYVDYNGDNDDGPDLSLYGLIEVDSVPEPGASLLLLTAAAGLLIRKRRAASRRAP